MNTTELLEKIESLLVELKAENAKTAKAAHGRARKIAGEVKTLANDYRKTSIAEDKAN
jgi:F0F1-type ATP synthase membrane subunit b/b'